MKTKSTDEATGRLTRRSALRTLAVGVGGLCVASAAGAQEAVFGEDDLPGEHWLSWEDGWEYAILGVDEDGYWIAEDEEGEFLVDPAGWIFDEVWYPIATLDPEGIWYHGNDGWLHLLGVEGATLSEEVI